MMQCWKRKRGETMLETQPEALSVQLGKPSKMSWGGGVKLNN